MMLEPSVRLGARTPRSRQGVTAGSTRVFPICLQNSTGGAPGPGVSEQRVPAEPPDTAPAVARGGRRMPGA